MGLVEEHPPAYAGGYIKRMETISDRRIFVAAAVRRQRFVRRLTSAATGILVQGKSPCIHAIRSIEFIRA